MMVMKSPTRPKRPTVSAPRLAILDDDPKVKRWYDTIALRSRVTADMYAGSLARLFESIGLTAEEAVAEASTHPDEFAARMVRYATDKRDAGILDSTVAKSLNGIRSYLKHRGVGFSSWPELRPIQGASLEKERVPRPEELGTILEHLNLRGRCVALLMAHAGLRPGVLGSYKATSGLTLDALIDLDISTLTFKSVPFVIRVPADLSKTRVAYTTFGTEQLGRVLIAYLTERRADGEELTGKSPVIAHSPDVRGVAVRSVATTGSRFMTTGAIMRDVRDAIEKCRPDGVTWRPYVLRAYCSTRLLLAEGDGRISRDLREAILGHSGGVASRYNVGKRWGEELLTEARHEYERASEFLETRVHKADAKEDVLRSLLTAVESATNSKSSPSGPMTSDTLVEAIRKAIGGNEATAPETVTTTIAPASRAGEQRVVSETEVAALLSQGWRFVAPLNHSHAVVQWDGATPKA